MPQYQKSQEKQQYRQSAASENRKQTKGISLAPPAFELAASPATLSQPTQLKTENSNTILGEISTTGAGATTTNQDGDYDDVGTEASERMAKTDQDRILKYADIFVEVASSYGLPPALLAGIASRESRGKNQLFGDGGNGVGMMQVDIRHHEDKSKAIREADNEREQIKLGISYGAEVLKSSLEGVQKKHPSWSKPWQLRGAVAAYNFGVGNVGTQKGLDLGSTGDDYSADVWARAKFYAQLDEFGGTAEIAEAANATENKKSEAASGVYDWLGDTFDGAVELAKMGLEFNATALKSIPTVLDYVMGSSNPSSAKNNEATNQTISHSIANISLSAKVGNNGTNLAEDVCKVQGKLRALGYLGGIGGMAETTLSLSYDGDEKIPVERLTHTIEAIVAFQKDQTKGFAPDGTISPGYSTHLTLNKNIHKSQVKEDTLKISDQEGSPADNQSYSIDKAVAALNKNAHAKSTGYCAKYVRLAINAGGIATPNNPVSAKNYNGYLEQFGFKQIDTSSYKKGDIAVIEAFTGAKKHPHGHIQMWNSSQWVSDFKQRTFYPGSDYRNSKPGFVIYRYGS